MSMDGIIPYALIVSVQEQLNAMGSGFVVKGVVANATDLPASGSMGDLYLVSGEGYASYVWNGSGWSLKDGDIATNAEILSGLYS